MILRFIFPGLLLLSILGSTLHSPNLTDSRAAPSTGEKTLVLYDASSGALPSESLMDFTDFPPGAALLAYADGAAVMDSAVPDMDTYAGWAAGQAITPGFPILVRTAGYQVNFTLQVESEAHTKDNRAGFSVIILDRDAKGIELAFWENEIWAQNDDRTGSLFTHGEGIAFAAAGGLTEYRVTIVGDTYTLTGNSQPLLSGLLRDYSQFEGFPDPYETPNFLFLGDDTSAAGARVRLSFVSVIGTEPAVPTITGTGILQPTASAAPLPSATPALAPTSAPAESGIEFCSSGWAFLAVTITGIMTSRQLRRRIR